MKTLFGSWYARGLEPGGSFAVPMNHTVLQAPTKPAKYGVMTSSQGVTLGPLTFANILFIPLVLTAHEFLRKTANCSFGQAVPPDCQFPKAKDLLTIALYMENHIDSQVLWEVNNLFFRNNVKQIFKQTGVNHKSVQLSNFVCGVKYN